MSDERLEQALRAEMAYYREHAHEGRDEASLAELRERCAGIVSERARDRRQRSTSWSMRIRFDVYPDAVPALRELRDRGLRLVAVSNWDCSLPAVLERCGLGELLDGTVTSAAAGARKPDPAIFEPCARAGRLRRRRRPSTSGTRPRRTSRAPGPPASERC